jgi:hypothetical protein
MSLDDIVAGDYGQVVKLTFIDTDTDAAADVSSYSSTIQMLFTDPDGNTATETATFDTDGSDGVIKYTLADGDIDAAGYWKVRGKVASGAAVLTSVEHTFLVVS